MSPPRMLAVDDSPLLRKFIERFLGDEFVVETAADGGAAIDLLALGKTYAVLLVDLAMPGVDGRQLYDVVAARFPALVDRIVFLTGGALSREDDRFLRSVSNAVVEKPFDNDALRDVIRRTAGLTT
jgi:CheY-like chemotaxis protein